MSDLQAAIAQLNTGGYTCVLRRGDQQVTSQLRGVKPLVQLLESGRDFSGYSAADKVVGKATAFLYILLGVRAVHAGVISRSALETLKRHGIDAHYDHLSENIINRAGDGICPFEAAVLDIHDPAAAYTAIRAKMTTLNITL